ncbi:MAG: MBG domain-containing protein [Kiritimatiellae bacterium]|nr:MBG domain-containing protein [Kiritimatiellia bacterium]
MKALRKKVQVIWPCILSILLVAFMLSSPGAAFAGTTNSTAVGLVDNFESYINGTQLIDGTNGWYADSTNVIVQNTTFYSGAQAARIPVDCTLSNRFESSTPTNIWIQLDLCASFYDGTNSPLVDTNAALMFYVNSNGHFVVHNGPATNGAGEPTPTNSPNWVELDNTPVDSNTWVRVKIYQDFAQTNWSLTVNRVELTNNIAFINPAVTNFLGFDLYNGSSTSFLDNVNVTAAALPPDVEAVPRQLTNSVMRGATPSPAIQYFDVTNSSSAFAYVVDVANNTWVSSFTTGGTLPANANTHFQLTYSNIPSGWAAGVSNQIFWFNTTAWGGTQSVAAVNVTLNIMDLPLSPASITTNVMKGVTPDTQTFVVSNTGPESLDYTITFPNTIWASGSSAGGTLAAGGTDTITVTYSNTADLGPGTSNMAVLVASPDWGGITKTVDVSVVVMDMPATPSVLSTNVMRGVTPAEQTFVVSNTGPESITYVVTFSNTIWVSASSSGGTLAPGEADTIPVTFSNTADLGPGTSNLVVLVTSPDWGGISKSVSLEMTVMDMPVTPSALSTNVMKGVTPAEQTFVVSNTGPQSLAYTISFSNTDWVSSSSNGTWSLAAGETATIPVTFSNTADLGPGTSNLVVLVTSPDWGGISKSVSLEMTVMDMPVTPSALSTNVMKGVAPAEQTFVVSNTGPQSLAYTISFSNTDWVSSSSNGTWSLAAGETATIPVTFSNTADLGPGTSNLVVLVTSPDWGGISKTVDVTMTVIDLPVTPSALSTNVMKGVTPAEQTFVVSNTGPQTIDYTITFPNTIWASSSSNGTWSLAAGETATIPVTFSNTADLGPGTSNLAVQVSSADWGGIAATVDVSLIVMDMPVAPTYLSTSVTKGVTPAEQTFVVSNTGPQTIDYTITFPNTIWVSSLSNGGTLAAGGADTIPVTYSNTADIGPGTSNLTVQITSPDWGGIAKSVEVSLTVTKKDQAITFPTIPDQWTTSTVMLCVTSTSMLEVSFTTNGPGVIAFGAATNLTFTNSGIVSITASQTGNTDWAAATPVTCTFDVSKVPAAVTLSNLTQTYDGTAREVTAGTSPEGKAVIITYDGNSWAPTNAGSYTIVGTINDALYSGMGVGTLEVAQTNQTITFPAIAPQAESLGSMTLSASASSGLTVSFTNDGGELGTNISGSTLVFNGIGLYTIVASQTGDVNHSEAPTVSRSFLVYGSNPTSNNIPWNDDFEGYYNLMPLIDGTNGWYGDSSNIVVQNTIFRGGSQAAVIPVDCTLPNRFWSDVSTNVWIQMDVKVAQYENARPPDVATDMAAMFYVNTNGYFVVHNGPPNNPSPVESLSWVELSRDIAGQPAVSNADGAWVRIHIYHDYARTNWALFADRVLLTNNIGFIDTTITNFTGFDLYSGTSTSYVDNVFVMATNPVDLTTNGNIWLPGMEVAPTALTNSVFKGRSITVSGSFDIWRTNGADLLGFTITTNAAWLSASPASGADVTETHQAVALTYNAAEQVGGTHTNVVTVTGYDASFGLAASNSPQTVTVVMNVMDLQASSTNLTNVVMVGNTPANQSIIVSNMGAGSFDYTVTAPDWLSDTDTSGTLGPGASDVITVKYDSTADWGTGVSNAIFTITSADGGGATLYVGVTLNVMDLQVVPLSLTNVVWAGDKPTNQTFDIINAGGGTFTFTTATGASWLACSSSSGSVGPFSTNTITLDYASTVGLGAMTKETTVTITSPDGGAAARTVNVRLEIFDVHSTMTVTPAVLSNVVWVGATPTNRTFEVRNSGGMPIDFSATLADGCPWITNLALTPDVVPAYGTNVLTVNYGSTSNWPAGFESNATIKVVSTNNGGATGYVSVVLGVLDIADVIEVAPSALYSGVVVPAQPPDQSFEVRNLSDVDFTYSMTTGTTWITNVTPGGTLAARSTATVTLQYTPTTDWTVNTESNGMVTVESADGGGASKPVNVTLYLYRSGITNRIPFYDTFEIYTNLTPLVGGINGWYGSSTSILVQQDVVLSGLQAAMLPVDCVLSNPFVPANATNVWIQMDMRPSLYDGTNYPVVSDTNSAWMFYVNSNGNFVVHNGPPTNSAGQPDPTNSVAWLPLTNGSIGTSGTTWVKIGIYGDFNNKVWDLYTNGTRVTNGIGFINTNLTNFAGFEMYNGAQTSYLDNVSVEAPGTVLVSTNSMDFQVMKGLSASDYFTLTAQTGVWTFVNTTSGTWLAANPAAGSVDALTAGTDIWINCDTLTPGSYAGAVYVSATNSGGLIQSQMVAVSLAVMDLQVAPTNFSSQIWAGATPAANLFDVWNAGAGSFQYETQTNADWLTCSSNIGTLGAYSTNQLALSYAPTAGWGAGVSNAQVKVWSTNGGGATQTVYVTLVVNDLAADMQVTTSTNLTNSMMVGQSAPPTQQSFTLTNAGDGSFNYTVTNEGWLADTSTSGTLTQHGSVVIDIDYDAAAAAALLPGCYTNIITISSLEGAGATKYVSVVLNVMDLQVVPLYLTNSVWAGDKPTNQTFDIINAGGGTFTFTTATGASWLACSSSSGSVGPFSTNTITLDYANTAGLGPMTRETTVTIASPDGGTASRTLYVKLVIVESQSSMTVTPPVLSNLVWIGATPTNRTFEVRNSSGSPLNFSATLAASCPWITSIAVTPDIVPPYGTNVLTVVYGSTLGWPAGIDSNASIKVVSTNDNGATQYVNVVVSVLDIANVIEVTPSALSSAILPPATPPNQSFEVRNLSDVEFDYSMTTSVVWIANVTPGGTLAARDTATVTLQYTPTTDWTPNTESNGVVTVESADGGGASKPVNVAIYVYSAGITNTIPFYDYFEQYTNLTPLVGGNNGWYGDSGSILVQQDVVLSGLQAAMIPVDCTLANPFMPANTTNVWIQMDMRPSLYDATNHPVITDTNTACMFYINSNGNFVVHNGVPTNSAGELDPTNSANWVTLADAGIGTSGTNWVKIGIYGDFNNKVWDLYTNGTRVTNGIGFINPNLTNFNGLNLYNGSATSYLDNVSVEAPGTVLVSPTNLDFQLMKGMSGSDYFTLTAQTGVWTFVNTTSDIWLAANPVGGQVDALTAGADIWVNCAAQALGSYTGAVYISATNSGGLIQTQMVAVSLAVMDLLVAPTNITSQVWIGATPAGNTFDVWNAGAGSFQYETQTNTDWLACSSNIGTLGAYSTNQLALSYAPTAGWNAGVSNAQVKVWSTNGGGATQTVYVTLLVNDLAADMQVTTSTNLTNSMMVGQSAPPTQQSFTLANAGDGSFNFMVTNDGWLADTSISGTLTAHSNIVIDVNYDAAAAAALLPGCYTNTITISSLNGAGATKYVSVVLNVMDLQVVPLYLTNTVWAGDKPTNQTFDIINAGAGTFTYTTATGASWLACSSNVGTVGPYSTNTITLDYANTAGLGPMTRETTVTIASPDGGTASRTLYVKLVIVESQSSMTLAPAVLSNLVWVGSTPTNRTFEVRNSSGNPLSFSATLAAPCPWITNLSVTPDIVPPYGTNVLTVEYGSTLGWPAGIDSNAVIKVVSTNDNGATGYVNVVVSVLDIANVIEVTPSALYSGVVPPATPADQSFEVRNLSDVEFSYSMTTSAVWVANVTAGGTLAARSTATVTIEYTATTDWTPNTESNGAVTVESADGGGASKPVNLKIYVYRSGITNTIPFYDYFEQYTNLTPLVGGINGWYGDSSSILVQQDVVRSGSQAVMIPVDCTLSNPFVPVNSTNVWIQMDMRPSLYDGSNNPVVSDTNSAWMFYINSNGNFVVHNGIPTNSAGGLDPTNSANWVTLADASIGTSGTNWVKIGIYEDFSRKQWDLYTNGTRVTNGIGFINPSLTNFVGFTLYSGAETSYLDNVSVEAPGTVLVSPTNLDFQLMKGVTASNYFTLTAQTGVWTFVNTTSDTWLAANPAGGQVDALTAGMDILVNVATQALGSYVGAVYVSATNSGGLIQTQMVAVSLAVMDLQVAPTSFTSQVWIGAQPATNLFDVWNAGAGSFQYETITNAAWLSCSSNSGTLGAYNTNQLALSYASTVGWGAGISNAQVKVWSTNGGGATQTVYVTLLVNDLAVDMQVAPTNLTNSIMAGQPAPTNQQSFTLANAGDGSFNYTITNDGWLAVTSTNGTLTQHSNIVVDVKYDAFATAALAPGCYTNTITISSLEGAGVTKYVDVVLNVMSMDVTPTSFSNSVMVGWAPTNQTFSIANAGIGSYNYTITVTNGWLSCMPAGGTMGSLSNQFVAITFSNTAGWALGTSNTTIIINSADGGGSNRTVDIALTIVGRATVFYASTNGQSIAPYTNWAMAATNIQDAIDAAISGDQVWVSNGTFTVASELVVTNGVLLGGYYGPENTFINGNYPATTNRCFNVAHSNAIVQGFTISNGCETAGGGVYLTAGAMISNCVVSGNMATETTSDAGGGIFADSFSIVTNCVIAGNYSAGSAGGFWLSDGAVAYSCLISNNTAASEGGGAIIKGDSVIWNSTFADNQATVQGGGLMLGEGAGDASIVWNCTFVNNSANLGGGLAAAGGFARNCVIHMNSAGIAGAGVFLTDGSDAVIQNCTIASNSPGYGVSSHSTSGGYFENNVIASNAVGLISTNVAFTNNCMMSTNGVTGFGNITNDPAFLNFADGNYRLGARSPCKNAGTNQAWMIGATDWDGNPRMIGPNVDMGAFENPMSWTVVPVTLTNQVMAGLMPTNQGFAVNDTGSNSLYYSITNDEWMSGTTTNGMLSNYGSSAILAVFSSSITSWPAGFSNTVINVVVSNDVSALYPPETQTVDVVMNIMQMQTAPASLTNNIMRGFASSQTFDVADLGYGLLEYTVSTGSYAWVSVSPVGGILTNVSTNTITVTYAADLPAGQTTGLLTVASSSGGGATQYVALTVNVIDLEASPGGLTNTVLINYTPTNRFFTLVNPGSAPLTYTLTTNATWVFCADPAGGVLAGPGTNIIDVSYASTIGWTPDTVSNAVVTIVSTNGGGATQTVSIVINVVGLLPPAGVTASKGTFADKVLVTWDTVTNATGYQVWRNTANITNTATNIDVIATNRYDDITAVPEVTYYYWVRSVNELGAGVFSLSDFGYRNLYPPAGVSATKGTHSDKVVVSWTAAAGAVGYEVWRNTSGDTGSATKVSSTDVVGTSYNDTIADHAVIYTYWVKTKGASGAASAFSASDTGWRGLSSPAVTASKGLPKEVSVTWTASAGATYYELWKSTTDNSSTATLLYSGTATSYRDMAVTAGNRYYYWVKAVCPLGDSGMGASAYGLCGAAKWDFNGDGRSDVWYYHEPSGRWYYLMTSNALSTGVFGGPGWVGMPTDYDGDGKADFGLYEAASGTWKALISINGYGLVGTSGFGGPGYTLIDGDYDGDGKSDPALYQESTGTWLLLLSKYGYGLAGTSGFGQPGDIAVPADYDGDGITDLAIYRSSTGAWMILQSGSGYQLLTVQFGISGYVPVPGAYNGQGHALIAIYSDVSGYWYIRTGPTEYYTVSFGQPGHVPMPADYDGDRYDDQCVFYRSSQDAIWYLWKSTEGYQMISSRFSRP